MSAQGVRRVQTAAAPNPAMVETFRAQEMIISRRLVADGEARGDDRRWQQAHRSFLDWAHVKQKEPDAKDLTPEQLEASSSRDACEVSRARVVCDRAKDDMCRTRLQHIACIKQVSAYKLLGEKIQEQMIDAKQQIEQCKIELAAAKESRRHRQEYDLMAKMIQKHPERKELHQKLATAAQEIEAAKRRRKLLEDKLELIKKRFYAFSVLYQEQMRDIDDFLNFDDCQSMEEGELSLTATPVEKMDFDLKATTNEDVDML